MWSVNNILTIPSVGHDFLCFFSIADLVYRPLDTSRKHEESDSKQTEDYDIVTADQSWPLVPVRSVTGSVHFPYIGYFQVRIQWGQGGRACGSSGPEVPPFSHTPKGAHENKGVILCTCGIWALLVIFQNLGCAPDLEVSPVMLEGMRCLVYTVAHGQVGVA